MKIGIVVETDRCRRWLLHLAELIKTSQSAEVVYQLKEPSASVSRELKTALQLEGRILGTDPTSGMSDLDRSNLPQIGGKETELVFDLTASGSGSTGSKTFEVRYNGVRGEEALFAALMTKGTPFIEIVDLQTGTVAASGTASFEAAKGLRGAMDAVFSRVAVLIKKVVEGSHAHGTPMKTEVSQAVTQKQVLSRMLREAAVTLIRSVYRAFFFTSHWRVGWRFVDGEGVAGTRDLSGEPWHVLKSPHNTFFADPFPIEKDGRFFLFFEALPHDTQKGVISMVEMTKDGPVGEASTVLEEPWHLSYPFVFERDGEFWMIPESSTNKEVVLYRAARFPGQWERHTVLLSGVEAADATIIEYEGRFWMFAVTRNGVGGYSDCLSLYYADDMFGPWQAHQKNPVLVDDRAARPAGRFFSQGGDLWRPVQDCRNGYGAALAFARVDELSPTTFQQSVHETLTPGPLWPGRKLHTLNKVGDLEVIDGCTYHPKSELAAKTKAFFNR
ncbi:glucosamine inositolphosphorylceramide transferase family protein [Roseibium sp.]|uniref:glucosamine inositolphosphorylceramide transferase family protein n=1 Tax=Roseibium sp. TaxID=1936156 RepID=UPI003D150898